VEATDTLPHYLNCIQYLGKDFIVVGATDRSLIRVYDRQKKTTVASIRYSMYQNNLTSNNLEIRLFQRNALHWKWVWCL